MTRAEPTDDKELSALRAENAALRTEIDRLHGSFRMRLGAALANAVGTNGMAGLAKLPVELAGLVRDARATRAWRASTLALECGLPDDPLLTAPRPQGAPARPRGARPIHPSVDLARRREHELAEILTRGSPLARADRAPRADRGANAPVLMVLHTVLPARNNGYTQRTHAVVRALAGASARPILPTARAGAWQEETLDGVRYRPLPPLSPLGTTAGYAAYVEAYADAIARAAEAAGAGLIHAASNHVTGQAAGLAARRLGLPFVYEVRGLWHVTRASVAPAYARSLGARAQEALEVETAAAADRVLVNGEAIGARLQDAGVAPSRVRLAPNGCRPPAAPRLVGEAARAARTALGLPPDAPVVGFVGSLTPYEGLEDVLAASARLHAVPHGLLIVGDGPAGPHLREIARRLGLSDRCVFTGAVAPARAAALLSLIDIAPLPRRDTEVARLVPPLKPLEAMASGAAVILSDLPPLAPFAANGRATLVPPGAVERLAGAMRLLLTDEAGRRAQAERGRAWALSERSWDATAAVVAQAHADLTGPQA